MSDVGKALGRIDFEPAPLRTRIIDSMRSAIEQGVLKPGDRLVEKDLCEQLGVSRTSLREALREFEAEGVIAQLGARGLTVVRINHRDAENIYRIRADLEALIFQQFLENADDEDLREAERLCGQVIRAYKSSEFSPIVDAKRQFYDFICDVARNRVALEMLQRLTLRTAQLRSKSVVRKERQAQSIEEMKALRDALLARDVDGARRIARAHVEHAALSALPFVEQTA
ncbi:GntR family transcriptional regulator [Jannaschia sp. EhC01]|nr:GntR family transcriptional regulator [Jannaschia sp. EhC01]